MPEETMLLLKVSLHRVLLIDWFHCLRGSECVFKYISISYESASPNNSSCFTVSYFMIRTTQHHYCYEDYRSRNAKVTLLGYKKFQLFLPPCYVRRALLCYEVVNVTMFQVLQLHRWPSRWCRWAACRTWRRCWCRRTCACSTRPSSPSPSWPRSSARTPYKRRDAIQQSPDILCFFT